MRACRYCASICDQSKFLGSKCPDKNPKSLQVCAKGLNCCIRFLTIVCALNEDIPSMYIPIVTIVGKSIS